MSKAIHMSILVPGIFVFVFLLAMLPVVIQSGSGENSVRLLWGNGIQSLVDYIKGVGTGDSFRFYMGKNERSFWEMIGYYFITSFRYVVVAGIGGTVIGIFVGIYFAVSNARWSKRFVDIVGALPDFVIVLILQFIIVYIARETGVVVFKVATVNTDNPAIVLPLIAMIIMPASYMIRNVSTQMKLTLTEDYIGHAKAKGLKNFYIIFYHAFPNVLPYMKSDLHKLMGIVMGNLFIVEYLFNNKGVSMLIFGNAFASHVYQYDIVVNGLLSLLLLYVLCYIVQRAFLYILGLVFRP